MTRLLFDAGETVFHFPLASNSRYLILAGNAKLWGCYPNCSSELGASGEPRKYEKQSVRNYFLLVVLGSALVFFFSFVCFFFFQKLAAGAYAHLSVWTWLEKTPLLWCEENAEWGRTPQPPLWLGSCAVGERAVNIFPHGRHTHSYSYAFIHSLLRVPGGPACTQTNVNSCTLTKHGSRQNCNQTRMFLHSPVRVASWEKADMQHSLNNNSLIYRRTIYDRLGFSAYCMSTFRGCAL